MKIEQLIKKNIVSSCRADCDNGYIFSEKNSFYKIDDVQAKNVADELWRIFINSSQNEKKLISKFECRLDRKLNTEIRKRYIETISNDLDEQITVFFENHRLYVLDEYCYSTHLLFEATFKHLIIENFVISYNCFIVGSIERLKAIHEIGELYDSLTNFFLINHLSDRYDSPDKGFIEWDVNRQIDQKMLEIQANNRFNLITKPNFEELSLKIEPGFGFYLKDDSKNLLAWLIETYKDAKPQVIAAMVFALNEKGLLKNNFINDDLDKVHARLTESFGSIGTRQALSKNRAQYNIEHKGIKKILTVHKDIISSKINDE